MLPIPAAKIPAAPAALTFRLTASPTVSRLRPKPAPRMHRHMGETRIQCWSYAYLKNRPSPATIARAPIHAYHRPPISRSRLNSGMGFGGGGLMCLTASSVASGGRGGMRAAPSVDWAAAAMIDGRVTGGAIGAWRGGVAGVGIG